MRARDIMHKAVETARDSDTVQSAAQRMRDLNIGFLPVIDEHDRVVGVVTDRDIAIRLVAEGLAPKLVSVGEVLTPELVACRPDDDLRRVQQLMIKNDKSRVLVSDDVGRLVGVISLSDVATHEPVAAADVLRSVAEREVVGGHGHLLGPPR